MEFVDLEAQQEIIRESLYARMNAVLKHGRYIRGPEVSELEGALATFVGVSHCISCANGTDALQIAQMALNIGPGDEVITPAFAYIATAETIKLLRATPIYIDVDPNSFTMDLNVVEAAITPRTRAIMPVSLYGQCADMPGLALLAEKYELPVIEDAAQSLGALIGERRSCSMSLIGCTSFFPSKPLGCYGDGGAIFTNDDQLAESIRQIASHGQDRRYHHVQLGVNSRLDTLQAAVLLTKLAIFPNEIAQRQRVAASYDALLGSSNTVKTPEVHTGYRSVYAQYTIQVHSRDAVAQACREAGIPVVIHYPLPLHRQPAVQNPNVHLVHSEKLAECVLSLPMHPYLADADIERISDVVATAAKKFQ